MIETKNLSFIYREEDMESGEIKEEKVLKDINIEIEKGSFTAVLGHNGSGKSTLAKHFNAILLPSGGKVYVKGMDTADENNIFNIRQSAGMVFQNPDNQIVSSIVEEDVAFGVENLGVEPKEIRKRVDNALKTVGMYEYRLKAPNKLSGGQKQRVAVAGIDDGARAPRAVVPAHHLSQILRPLGLEARGVCCGRWRQHVPAAPLAALFDPAARL